MFLLPIALALPGLFEAVELLDGFFAPRRGGSE
jgi:hypothetical protein